jgi:hypothetical protein
MFADTAVQTITGVIESISMVVDGTEIYGIRVNYNEKLHRDVC